MKRKLSAIIYGIGWIFILIPIFMYWLIHGNYDRYLWIINGPFPLSHLGSAPFQVIVYGGIFFTGVLLIVTAFILRKRHLN